MMWQQRWEERRQQLAQANGLEDLHDDACTTCLAALIWAAERLGVVGEALLSAATQRPDDPTYRPIRLAALAALAAGPSSDSTLAVLEKAAVGNDPEVRTLAADAVARLKGQRAAPLADQLLSDRTSFSRLLGTGQVDAHKLLRSAVSQLHYQGVVLPWLLARHDSAALTAVLKDRQLPDAARLGALEALATLATEATEAQLRAFAETRTEDEELRKAAWRALRRSRRARLRSVQPATAEV